MDIPLAYQTATFPHPFSLRQYITPAAYCDPKKQILERENMDYRKRPHQGKFKVTTKDKICYFQEQAKQYKKYPSPQKYVTEGNLLQKRNKSQSALNKVDLKASKNTFIQQIEKQAIKNKPPGIGKYDLTKISDFNKKHSSLKKKEIDQKRNNLDNVVTLAAEIPGPGHFNPYLQVKKIKVDRTDYKFYQAKHKNDEKKLVRSLSTKLGPSTYNPQPLAYKTFSTLLKVKEQSRWSHGNIEVRKGCKSAQKMPSPADYASINQWFSTDGKSKEIGKVKMLNKLSRAKSAGVYH